ncbi:MAG: hypothetical protein AAGA08_15185 [Pseudomonadota bacterium]
MIRSVLAAFCLVGCAACSTPDPVTDEMLDLGDFRLLSNVAVTTNAKMMGVSRDATAEEWEEVLEAAVTKRLGRYEGEVPYTVSYSLDGFILSTRGGRLVLAPNSAMSLTVHIWQTQPLKRLEARSKQLLILEGLDGETALGSGLFRTRDEQMERLALRFAAAVERWLGANSDLFGVDVSDAAKEAARKDDAAAIAEQVQSDVDTSAAAQ